MNAIGNNIQNYLDLYNMNRIDLARQIGVTPTAICAWIKGTRVPRIEYIDKMCSIFRCERGDLFNEEKSTDDIKTDILLQRIVDLASRLNDEGKEKVLTYMSDLSGRFLK